MASKMTLTEGKYGLRASLESEWTPDTAAYLADRQVAELELNIAKGWREDRGLCFLSELSFLKSLDILDLGIRDISPIHELGNLRRLGITTYCSTAIDFSKFPYLESCGLEWRPKSESLFDCITLKELFVNRYKGKNVDSFSRLVNLESLKILNAPVANLQGLRTLSKLRSLRIAGFRPLSSLEGIDTLASLENLLIQTCRKFSKIDEVAFLANLQFFNLDNCGDIVSLNPLRKLDNLNRLGFPVSTNILDGDMTLLLELKNLTYVSFRNRKHYTHTREELNAILSKRHPTRKP